MSDVDRWKTAREWLAFALATCVLAFGVWQYNAEQDIAFRNSVLGNLHDIDSRLIRLEERLRVRQMKVDTRMVQ